MGADLNNIVKCQKLTDDHVQFLIYQILRGLKVGRASFSRLVLKKVPHLFIVRRGETVTAEAEFEIKRRNK